MYNKLRIFVGNTDMIRRLILSDKRRNHLIKMTKFIFRERDSASGFRKDIAVIFESIFGIVETHKRRFDIVSARGTFVEVSASLRDI